MDDAKTPDIYPEFSPSLIVGQKPLKGVHWNEETGKFEAWIRGKQGGEEAELFLVGIYGTWSQAFYHRVLFIEETVLADHPRVAISEDEMTVVCFPFEKK